MYSCPVGARNNTNHSYKFQSHSQGIEQLVL